MRASSRVEAVILAAGNGSRIWASPTLPKPLVCVAGRPLLERALRALASAGVRRAHVVIGYGGDAIRSYPFDADIETNWLDNPRFEEPNGLSLLRAAGDVHGPFVLMMADHVFERGVVERFVQEAATRHRAVLAVDSNTDAISDIEDATKVWIDQQVVRRIGKTLAPYNAIDTGLFIGTTPLIDAMTESARHGDPSLSGGVRRLAAAGGVDAWSVGHSRWVDVDTSEALIEAEALGRQGLLDDAP